MMYIQQVAALANVSVRTLHHYDEIGLLRPNRLANGYRHYDDKHIERLQRILFYRALHMPLEQIQRLLNEEQNELETLQKQREKLIKQRDAYDELIATIEKTIRTYEGENTMTNEERFEGMNFNDDPYREEAEQKWGKSAVDWARQSVAGREQEVKEQMQTIFKRYASLVGTEPQGEEAQAVTKDWYKLLNTLGDYPLSTFHALGEMYVQDERFKANLDQLGDGVAQFMRDAMQQYKG